MLEDYKKNITIDKLEKDERTISINRNSSDFVSYPEFIKYFEDLKVITKHNIVIGINFTYGWMPTIFDFRSDKFNDVEIVLNKAKLGQVPTVEELELLKSTFNNSLVGTSKILHFINPNVFAIWDSRVFRYLTGTEPHQYRLDNYNSYLAFLEFCKLIVNSDKFADIHKSLQSKVGNEMTPLRAVELIMYLKGERPINGK